MILPNLSLARRLALGALIGLGIAVLLLFPAALSPSRAPAEPAAATPAPAPIAPAVPAPLSGKRVGLQIGHWEA
ncbi:MAG TPA: hypothetical protein VD886_12890, partial [Herpetosiphonaceae bacterium]|nr:hypothetical protein [Herpetosiphonaceae bacterium]